MRGQPQLPHLTTFQRKASWSNRAGHIDRSACMEVRAAELWPLVNTHHWRSVRTSSGLLAHTSVTVNARLLHQLHQTRLPRRLLGDLRTPKSNAMKNERDVLRGARKHLNRGAGDQPWIALPDFLDSLYSNPNKGATRSKRLGLWSGVEPAFINIGPWTQHIRIERWRRGKKRSAVSDQRSNDHRSRPPQLVASHPAPPQHWHYLICPQCNLKVFKLFMVLATMQEVNDAELAEGWIKMLDARCNGGTSVSPIQLDPSLLSLRAALIDRYGQLFRARRLVCRKCLGIRYGEVKKSRGDAGDATPQAKSCANAIQLEFA